MRGLGFGGLGFGVWGHQVGVVDIALRYIDLDLLVLLILLACRVACVVGLLPLLDVLDFIEEEDPASLGTGMGCSVGFGGPDCGWENGTVVGDVQKICTQKCAYSRFRRWEPPQ